MADTVNAMECAEVQKEDQQEKNESVQEQQQEQEQEDQDKEDCSTNSLFRNKRHLIEPPIDRKEW